MKIRQYTAATMQEAIMKIKVDLGPDAVILHQRKVKRGGVMGFFAQDMVEVLAAIDPNEGKGSDKQRGRHNALHKQSPMAHRASYDGRISTLPMVLRDSRSRCACAASSRA